MDPYNYRDDPYFEGYIFPDDPNYVPGYKQNPSQSSSANQALENDPGSVPHSVIEPPEDAPSFPPALPTVFEARYLAAGHIFDTYRRRGNIYSSMRQVPRGWDEFSEYPFPRPGIPNPRNYTSEESWKPARTKAPLIFWPLNTETSSLFDDENDKRARSMYGWARGYFQRVRNTRFKFRKLLHYNDNNLLINMSHWSEQSGRHRDLVLKVSAGDWDSSRIREEKRNLQRVARAAHCIQEVGSSELGLRPQRTLPLDDVDEFDSSSGELSGDESPADEPPPPPRTRRDRLDNDPEGSKEKTETHRLNLNRKASFFKTRQSVKSQPELREISGPMAPFPHDGDEWDLDRRDFILFDSMENGDLEHLLYKLVEAKRDVPNRVLWSFWLCLIKACVALEYPPRKFHPRRRGADDVASITALAGSINITDDTASTGKVIGNDLFEEIPVPSRRWATNRIVHFDIDPSNILIGGLDPSADDTEHSIVPRLKLADFGSAKKIKPNKSNEYYLERRTIGKWGFYAPEQFGIEWDYIAPGPEISEHEVAGNYGSWTNIWGIALTMWMVITKLRSPLPPQRSMLVEDGPLHYCPLLLDDPKYSNVDEELRRTIAECLRHAPNSRPRLADLLKQAERGAARDFEGETDDIIRAWVQSMLTCLKIFDAITLDYDRDNPPERPPSSANSQYSLSANPWEGLLPNDNDGASITDSSQSIDDYLPDAPSIAPRVSESRDPR
ncbi:hypothetical protein F5Y13DRAFT_205569 [Hypoxylon sp. FL1857]|nr:hypothetical protein F5Y13DRAFT_205569 [Hypoxylon sp. FL1857]